MDTKIKSKYRKVTLKQFRKLIKDKSLVSYSTNAIYYIEGELRLSVGCVLKIRDKFHYLYFDSENKTHIDSYLSSIQNTFVPLELYGKVRSYYNVDDVSMKVILLEIKRDCLIIQVNLTIFFIYNNEDIYYEILEQYNLNLING